MNKMEARVFRETKLRNLKRTYAKLSHHAEFVDECSALKSEIDKLESVLN